ncbi:MAG TPA: hypothetical protein PKG94_13950 [Gordonia sp. (in: high G+C Gram-positive bacteria)]|nr:hypothetical protein [Gordonia sp. (in: high G+C Gram-positive bacteria)]
MRTSGRRSGDARRRGVAVVCALAAALVLPLAGPAGAEPPAPAKPAAVAGKKKV